MVLMTEKRKCLLAVQKRTAHPLPAFRKQKRTPEFPMFFVLSAGKFLNTQFADQGNLDLTWIGQLVFDTLTDIMGDLDHRDIVDDFRLRKTLAVNPLAVGPDNSVKWLFHGLCSACQVKWQVGYVLQTLASYHHVEKFNEIFSAILSIFSDRFDQFLKRNMVDAVDVTRTKRKRSKP